MNFQNLNFKSQKSLLFSLSEDIKQLKNKLDDLKSVSLRVAKNKKAYTTHLVAFNTISGVFNGLSEKEMTLDAAEKLLFQAYSSVKQTKVVEDDFVVDEKVIKVTEDKQEGIDTFVKSDTRGTRDTSDDTKIANQLSNLRLYRSKLPARIKGVYSIVQLPVIPIFRNLAVSNPAALKNAGFKTLHFSGDDLEGYVILDNQSILLLDYEKYNKQFLESVEEDYEKSLDEYKAEYKIWKEKSKAWELAKEDFDNSIDEYHKELIKYNKQFKLFTDYEKSKSEFDILNAEYLKKKSLYQKKKITEEPLAPKIPKKVKKPVRPVEPDELPVFSFKKPVRPPKVYDFDTDDLSEVITNVLEEFAENSNVDYILMSDKYLRNPKSKSKAVADKDISSGGSQGILCFWIAEKWKVKNLEQKFGRVLVEDWGFTF